MTVAKGLIVIQEILKESRKLIRSKKHWNQGFCLDSNNQPISCFRRSVVKYNTTGAIAFTTKKLGHNEKFAHSATRVLERCVPSVGRDWNTGQHIYPSLLDYVSKATHADTIKLFDNAIELMKGSTLEAWLPINYRDLRGRKVQDRSVSQ